eukprot:45651-Eustigmatos_ZCMA.PRE.1
MSRIRPEPVTLISSRHGHAAALCVERQLQISPPVFPPSPPSLHIPPPFFIIIDVDAVNRVYEGLGDHIAY